MKLSVLRDTASILRVYQNPSILLVPGGKNKLRMFTTQSLHPNKPDQREGCISTKSYMNCGNEMKNDSRSCQRNLCNDITSL